MKACPSKQCLMSMLTKLNFLAPLMTRVVIATVFAGAGWGKLHNLDKTIAYFMGIGMPSAHILAPMVASLEFICGLFLLVGFATRFAAVPLIVIMMVAIKTAKWADVTDFSALFSMSEFLYIPLLIWLVFYGAGKVSVDHLIVSKCCKLTNLCKKEV